jgi:hypothetical protein
MHGVWSNYGSCKHSDSEKKKDEMTFKLSQNSM